jgi:choline kinase
MEAIILAGGKAERLGDAAGGKPKALVPVAGRRSRLPGRLLARAASIA